MNATLKIALLALPFFSGLPMSVTLAQGGGPIARPVSVGSRVRIFAPSVRRDRYVGRIDSLDVNEIVLDTAKVRRRLGFETGPVLVESYRVVKRRAAA